MHMKYLILPLTILLCILLAMGGCANFSYEGHARNSIILWAARGNASPDELREAVRNAIADTPGVLNIHDYGTSSAGEIIWTDNGKEKKIGFEFSFQNGNADQRGVYFNAVYFADHSPSAIDVNGRARLQNLLDDLQRRLGRNALKSAKGVVIQ